jgi:hypothetical protein
MIGQCSFIQGDDHPGGEKGMFGSYIYLPVVLLALLIDKVYN